MKGLHVQNHTQKKASQVLFMGFPYLNNTPVTLSLLFSTILRPEKRVVARRSENKWADVIAKWSSMDIDPTILVTRTIQLG